MRPNDWISPKVFTATHKKVVRKLISEGVQYHLQINGKSWKRNDLQMIYIGLISEIQKTRAKQRVIYHY